MKFPSYNLELEKIAQGKTWVIGCDEVGRGCLAGPVVAGAVVLHPESAKLGAEWYAEINDSKKLSVVKRFTLEKLLRKEAIAWGIGVVSPEVIDKVNIHVASLMAMHKAVQILIKKISNNASHGTAVLVDGRFTIPNLSSEIYQEAIVGGDGTVVSIAAASILAKTYRDRLMMRHDAKFPGYDFAQNKGYGTKMHKAALRKHGVSQFHRKSFIHI